MKDEKIKMSKLLKMMIANIKSDAQFEGMCLSALYMVSEEEISGNDRYRIEVYLRENKPANSPVYWWKRYRKAPRIKWLGEQIKKLKSKGL